MVAGHVMHTMDVPDCLQVAGHVVVHTVQSISFSPNHTCPLDRMEFTCELSMHPGSAPDRYWIVDIESPLPQIHQFLKESGLASVFVERWKQSTMPLNLTLCEDGGESE